MAMLGLKTLPLNHPLHRLYRVLGVIVGVVLAALGVAGLLVSGTFLGVPTSTWFSGISLVAGLVFVAAALQGRNGGAEANAYAGALLIALGLLALLTMGEESSNVLDVSMTNAVIWFVAGMTGLAAGFYGRVGQPEHSGDTP